MTLVTLVLVSKKIVQGTVYASLGTTETGQFVLNVTTLAKNAQGHQLTVLPALAP